MAMGFISKVQVIQRGEKNRQYYFICPAALAQALEIQKGEEIEWVVEAFNQKMQTEAAQQHYKQRGMVAEFPHAWIKDKLGLRQFRLRGLIKVGMEALWACLTYNIQQWIRLLWRPQPQAVPFDALTAYAT